MPLVTIDAVSKRFGDDLMAVNDVSLNIESGSIVVLLGPSGAGKSTLLRMLNGLETPTVGKIVVDGTTVLPKNLPAIRRRVGMIFQQFNLVGRLSVLTNVLVGRLGKLTGLRRFLSYFYLFHSDDLTHARKAIERVGLTDKVWNRADRLSGGQQQRVGIARALAQEPILLLADEPVASLDPLTADSILSLIRRVVREDGLTAIVTLHQVDLARRFGDRIIALNQGKLVFDGVAAALTEQVAAQIYSHSEPVGAMDSSFENRLSP